MASKIKKGDNVIVIAGSEKDKEGKVLAVNTKDNTVIVEGVNMVTKHAKPSQANPQGGAPDFSNMDTGNMGGSANNGGSNDDGVVDADFTEA